MKILALSDIHGNHGIYRWIPGLSVEHNVETVVLAGDLLGTPEGFERIEDAQRADAHEIVELLRPVGVPVLYIMGNDDMIELGPGLPEFHSLHARRYELGGFGFVGYQYSLPFMGGIFEKPESEVAVDIADLAPLLDDRTVLVTHNPAIGELDTGNAGIHAGSESILRAIRSGRVRAHIHGHVHSAFGRSGVHFNVASGGRRLRGMVIDLETMIHEVIDEGDIPWDSGDGV